MTKKRILGAFNQGEVPRIACFDKATVPLGVDLDALVAAMQAYVDDHVAPIWATPATLFKSNDFVSGAWAMVFLDDADAPGALAYHDLTPDGLPIAKVFVKTTLENGDLVSVSASHELVEMLVDPAINMMTTGPDPKAVYAYESADPVEALSFKVRGVPMSDFVTPAYFEDFHKPGSVRFDYLNKVKKPFQILKDGYQNRVQEREVDPDVREPCEGPGVRQGGPAWPSQRGEEPRRPAAGRSEEDQDRRAAGARPLASPGLMAAPRRRRDRTCRHAGSGQAAWRFRRSVSAAWD